MIAGIKPFETHNLNSEEPSFVLEEFEKICSVPETAHVFTISYDFGNKLQGIDAPGHEFEPDIHVQSFRSLIVYDYESNETLVEGDQSSAELLIESLMNKRESEPPPQISRVSRPRSNFTKEEYVRAVMAIQDEIRKGYTYQTNLTQQFRSECDRSPHHVFKYLRKSHPAAFSSFITREEDTVVSISPERFFSIEGFEDSRIIRSSPIKGTRRRGSNPHEDRLLKAELASSEKDRAENTMIVDLIRNDLGRVCQFGSVDVEDLCAIEEHPSLFHMVSTVSGTLRQDIGISDVLAAVFPCGSITGCPKLSTMKLIAELEKVPRGLSMGAIGYKDFNGNFDLNVAIRTMVFRGRSVSFNVGGGVVIDSDPVDEYEESLLKAKAILAALSEN
ncbi:MAG: aminodeoxychorismate synthase component I [Pyrinomonadaceae bacterium]|nr:aminodeoxychorismate synthase component I [Pyrinomonadaceae bacterium]